MRDAPSRRRAPTWLKRQFKSIGVHGRIVHHRRCELCSRKLSRLIDRTDQRGRILRESAGVKLAAIEAQFSEPAILGKKARQRCERDAEEMLLPLLLQPG